MKPNSSYWSIEQLPGLDEECLVLLKNAGINSTQDLLRCTSTNESKQQLAHQLQVNINHVNKWVAMAELARVPGVGCEHCGLILHCGVASVEQLSITSVPRLHKQILRLHVSTMGRRDLCPPVEQIQGWIRQAQLMSQTRGR